MASVTAPGEEGPGGAGGAGQPQDWLSVGMEGAGEPRPADHCIRDGDFVVLKREDVFKAVQVQRRK